MDGLLHLMYRISKLYMIMEDNDDVTPPSIGRIYSRRGATEGAISWYCEFTES